MRDDDTIVALATTAGPAAMLIVRTSGPQAFELAGTIAAGKATRGAWAACLRFADLEVQARCCAFRGPASHTGQDVVEYHLPGNPLLGRLLIEFLVRLGARQADPGEFSARAFFNGRMRLDEAEGVAAAIAATNDRELSAARRLRAGELAGRLVPIMDDLANLLALCELGIDFVEEQDIVVLDPADAADRVSRIRRALAVLQEGASALEQLGKPPRIALVGRPNAGKSTLLNALVGYRRAVSSAQPGTTRDALSADIELPSGTATLIDLAGLGDEAVDPLDAEGRRRAWREAETADLLVLLRDVTADQPGPDLPRPPDLTVLTKLDLCPGTQPGLVVSAVTGEGLAALRAAMNHAAFESGPGGENLALSARHREQVSIAIAALEVAETVTSDDPELLALHLREALDALGKILGIVSPDDLLGRIFSRFCIGK